MTGKGGTGKTTVAGALALALAGDGRRVLVAEVESRQGLAQLFDTPPLPYQERSVAHVPGHGEVVALAVDPEEALLEYLDLFYNLRQAGRVLKKLGAVDFATTIAPGLRDVLLTGKIKEATTRTNRDGRPVYDAVVLDAPPTGRIVRFLNVSAEVAGLARVGPVRSQADSVMSLLRSPSTVVHAVTLLEEMPVQETLDGIAELRAVRIPVGHIVVNMVRPPTDLAATPVPRRLAAGLRAGGLPHDAATVSGLVAEAQESLQRRELERNERAALADAHVPVVELELLPDAVDLGGLHRLADQLRAQGLGNQETAP